MKFLLVVELECLRKLVHELPGGVDELRKDRRNLLTVPSQESASKHAIFLAKLHFSAVSRSTDALPVGELMSKHQPVFFYEGLVALNSPVERVQEQLSHSTSLTCPVPTVATVDNHARP